MTDIQLTSDPVFQLNTLLWALQDVAPASGIRPVLRQAGYYLRAIGQRVIVPVDPTVLETLRLATGSADRTPARPDLWLGSGTDGVEPVLELKAHGFSRTSSNAVQASKLIVSVADLGPSLGDSKVRPGHLIYVTPVEDANSMNETLLGLREELSAGTTSVAPTAVIGIVEMAEGIALASPAPAQLPEPARAALATPAVVLERSDPDASLQPLYFVPWIPGIEDSQDARLHAEGLRELTARLLTQAMSVVGPAQPPSVVVLTGSALLERATFGIFAHWREADRRTFADAAARIVYRALGSITGVRIDKDRLEVDLPSADIQAAVIDKLEKADPADPSKSLATAIVEPPTLWDSIASTDPVGPTNPEP